MGYDSSRLLFAQRLRHIFNGAAPGPPVTACFAPVCQWCNTVFEATVREKLGPLVLRLALGLICCYHGFLKIMARGGMNWSSGLPLGWQLAIAWAEFGAGIAILIGLYVRWASGLVFLVVIGSLAWFQGLGLFSQPLASLEQHFLLIFCALALLFVGGGPWVVPLSTGAKSVKKR